jgi:putative transposase
VALAKEIVKQGKFKILRVCRVLRVSRANQYKNPKPRPKRYAKKEDSQVLIEILNATRERGTYGYPRTTAVINRSRRLRPERPWNEKRVHRVMAIHGLLLERQQSKPKRPHLGQVITARSNLRYCTDIFEIRCWNGEKVFTAFSLDCHDRELMSYVAEKRPLYHGDIIRLMDQTVTHRFGEFIERLPNRIQWLSDQGPQFKADQTVRYGEDWGFDVRTTPAYSPESNGMAEAFVKLFKRDYVYTNELWTAESVLRRLPEWFADYNQHHPHSGLNMQSPLEYREANTESHPILSA